MPQQAGLWDDAPVLSVYTDGDAVDDGALVAVGDKNRVTRTLFEFLVERLTEKPPNCWPVEMMGYFTANKQDEPGLARALAATRALIDENATQAQRVYDENIGGGIWKGTVQLGIEQPKGSTKSADGREVVTGFTEGGGDADTATDRVVWLMPNELGGLTLMFPSDY